jgi:hypothetical protein
MKKSIQSWFLAFVVLTVLLSGCAPDSTPFPPTQIRPTFTPSPIPPTFTPEPTVTEESTALLPGLKPADVTGIVKQRGFTCDPVEEVVPYYITTCIKDSVDYSLRVDIWGRKAIAVDWIDSSVLQSANPDKEIAASFLAFMATMPYDGAVQEEARNWVETTLPSLTGQDDVREKVFAGVKYSLHGIPTALHLVMGDLP